MIRTIEAAQYRLRAGRRALAFEIKLLEDFEAGLDLGQDALRGGHFLLDALALEFPAFDLRLGAVQGGFGRMESFGRGGDLRGGVFQSLTRGGLTFENLTTLVFQSLDAPLRRLTACLESGQFPLQTERFIFRFADFGTDGLK